MDICSGVAQRVLLERSGPTPVQSPVRKLIHTQAKGAFNMASEKRTLSFSEDNFDREVLKSGEPALVDFTADWCPPCRAISPVIDVPSLEGCRAPRGGVGLPALE